MANIYICNYKQCMNDIAIPADPLNRSSGIAFQCACIVSREGWNIWAGYANSVYGRSVNLAIRSTVRCPKHNNSVKVFIKI